MYKTILVPLDGSDMAEAILPHVEEVARLCGAAVIFLNVIELPHIIPQDKGESYTGLPYVTAADVEQQGQEARRYLDDLTAREAAKGITTRGLVEHGPIVATILRLAAEESADLISSLSPAQILKIASGNMLLCRFRVDDDIVWNLLTNHTASKVNNDATSRLHANILMSGRFAETL